MKPLTNWIVLAVVATVSVARADPLIRAWGPPGDFSPSVEYDGAQLYVFAAVSGIQGLGTPAHNGMVMECTLCLLWFETGPLLSQTSTEAVFGGATLRIETAPGSTVDPGGCVDINGDGICYTESTIHGRWTPEFRGSAWEFQIAEFALRSTGLIHGSGFGALAAPIANAYGIPGSPWWTTVDIDTTLDPFAPGSYDVTSVRLEGRMLPEPSSLFLFAMILAVVSPCLARRLRATTRF